MNNVVRIPASSVARAIGSSISAQSNTWAKRAPSSNWRCGMLGRTTTPWAEANGKRLGQSARCNGAEGLSVIKQQGAVRDRAKAVRLFQDRFEHRCEVAGR